MAKTCILFVFIVILIFVPYLAIFILLVCATYAAFIDGLYTYGNGRPGCRLSEEFGRTFRNNWDPIRYWVCQGSEAVSYVCPTEYLYSDSHQCCIHWAYWVWSQPFDPPSLAQWNFVKSLALLMMLLMQDERLFLFFFKVVLWIRTAAFNFIYLPVILYAFCVPINEMRSKLSFYGYNEHSRHSSIFQNWTKI